MGVKQEKYQRRGWLVDCSYSNINAEKLPIAALSVMQYRWSLNHLFGELFVADPTLRHVYVLKSDVR